MGQTLISASQPFSITWFTSQVTRVTWQNIKIQKHQKLFKKKLTKKTRKKKHTKKNSKKGKIDKNTLWSARDMNYCIVLICHARKVACDCCMQQEIQSCRKWEIYIENMHGWHQCHFTCLLLALKFAINWVANISLCCVQMYTLHTTRQLYYL